MTCHSPWSKSRLGMISHPFFGLSFRLVLFCSTLCCNVGIVHAAEIPAADTDERAEDSDNNVLDDEDVDWEAYASFTDEAVETFETNVHGLEVDATDETTAAAETIHVEEEVKRYRSFSEVMNEQVGVQVRSTGGAGAYSTAQIRGSYASQVDVYLDGVLLNSGGMSVVNLGDLNLDLLSSIEVYRGSTPVVLGLGSIGGAIALHTRDGENEENRSITEMSATYGSWQTWRGVALHSSYLKNVKVLNLLSVQGSEGDFKYLNRNGTLANDDDDEIISRQNNAHQMFSHLLKLTLPVGKMKLSLVNNLFVKQQGVAGIESMPTQTASLHTLREFVAVQGKLGRGRSRFLRWSGGYIFNQSHFNDLDGEIGIGHQSMVSKSRSITGHVVGRVVAEEAFRWDTRVEGRFDTYGIHNLLTDEQTPPGKRIRAGAGTDFAWFPISELQIVPSVRMLFESATSELPPEIGSEEGITLHRDDVYFLPSIGTKWKLSKRFTHSLNLGRYVRTPSLYELFGDRGVSVGNPELVAEEGLNADTGMTYTYEGVFPFRTAKAYAGVFGCWSENLIAYIQYSQDTMRAENVSAARALGAETSLQAHFLKWFSLLGNYTYLQTVNRSDWPFYEGRQLPGRPRHEAYVKVAAEKRFSSFNSLAWLDLNVTGNNYLDQANMIEDVLGKALLGAGLQMSYLPQSITLTVEAKNLLNTIVIEDEEGRERPLRDYRGFSLPGRSIFVTLHWKM